MGFVRTFAFTKFSLRAGVRLVVVSALFLVARLFAEEPSILIGTNRYSAFRTDLPRGAWVYVDAEPAGATPVRATQRSLGYREVDYKSAVYPTLAFRTVTPTTNGATATYDYSAQ